MMHAVRLARPEAKARMVWLHGLGSHEGDLLGAAQMLLAPIDHLALRAPIPYFGGFAWFDIDFSTHPPTPDLEQAVQSRDQLVEWLGNLPTDLPLIVAGFSQGAMLTLAVVAEMGERLAGAVVLSGAPIPDLSAPEDFPVFLAHGDLDDVLPVSGADEILEELEAYGAEVTSFRYPIGHGVSEETLTDLDEWLRRRFG